MTSNRFGKKPGTFMRLKILSFVLVSVCTASLVKGQCNFDQQEQNCKDHFAGSGGKYLKSYTIDFSQSQNLKSIVQKYIFSKGSSYFMSLCSDDGMYVTMYDKAHKMVATSYDPRTKKHYPAMSFKCTSTGMYYFHFSFVGNKKDGCGVAVMGYDR